MYRLDKNLKTEFSDICKNQKLSRMIIHPPKRKGYDLRGRFPRRAQTDFTLLCAARRGGPMHARKRIVDSVRVSYRPEIISIDPAQDKSASRSRAA